MSKIIFTDDLTKQITNTLRSTVLIEDLSTYPDVFLSDIAAYTEIDDMVANKKRYELSWDIFKASNTMKLYCSIIDNAQKHPSNLYTKEFIGSLTDNVVTIVMPRNYIKRSFYNTSAAGEHEVTPANANFIALVAKLFGHHKDFIMLQKEHYVIINTSYIKMVIDHEQVLSSHYVEKYILKLGGTPVSTSKRADFKKGLNEVISEKHTIELFGKEFLQLTKKELKLFEMYLE